MKLLSLISTLQVTSLLKGTIVHKSFWYDSKSMFVAGMKTESEFPDNDFDFIRQNGIPSALRCDNANLK
jgi:hypothetical protein